MKWLKKSGIRYDASTFKFTQIGKEVSIQDFLANIEDYIEPSTSEGMALMSLESSDMEDIITAWMNDGWASVKFTAPTELIPLKASIVKDATAESVIQSIHKAVDEGWGKVPYTKVEGSWEYRLDANYILHITYYATEVITADFKNKKVTNVTTGGHDTSSTKAGISKVLNAMEGLGYSVPELVGYEVKKAGYKTIVVQQEDGSEIEVEIMDSSHAKMKFTGSKVWGIPKHIDQLPDWMKKQLKEKGLMIDNFFKEEYATEKTFENKNDNKEVKKANVEEIIWVDDEIESLPNGWYMVNYESYEGTDLVGTYFGSKKFDDYDSAVAYRDSLKKQIKASATKENKTIKWRKDAGTFSFYKEMQNLMFKAFAEEIKAGKDVSLQASMMGDKYTVMVDFKPAIDGTMADVKKALEDKISGGIAKDYGPAQVIQSADKKVAEESLKVGDKVSTVGEVKGKNVGYLGQGAIGEVVKIDTNQSVLVDFGPLENPDAVDSRAQEWLTADQLKKVGAKKKTSALNPPGWVEETDLPTGWASKKAGDESYEARVKAVAKEAHEYYAKLNIVPVADDIIEYVCTAIEDESGEDVDEARIIEILGFEQTASIENSDTVLSDMVNLSSGTLSTLTGEKNYDKLDVILEDWVEWYQEQPKGKYDSWKASWNAYEISKKASIDKKVYYTQEGIGKAKYVVNFHDGIKKHKDGSDFYDIKIFNNKEDLKEFEQSLLNDGYTYRTALYSKKASTKIDWSDKVMDKTDMRIASTKTAAIDWNKITEEGFQAYEDVRQSGVTNMFDVKTVGSLSGLDPDIIMAIMKNYAELMKKYPNVRKASTKTADRKAVTDWEMAKNPKTSPEILTKLSKDPDVLVQEEVARNPNTPIFVLDEMSKIDDVSIKYCVAVNPSTMDTTLIMLTKDDDETVRDAALKALEKRMKEASTKTAAVAWSDEAVTKELLAEFGKGKNEEALKELAEEIEGSLDLEEGRWSSFGDCGKVEIDGDEYNLIQNEEEAEIIAQKYVEDMLETEPESFSQSWLQSFIYMTDTDRRLIANDMADSRMDGMDDEDALKEAEMEDEYEALTNEYDELEEKSDDEDATAEEIAKIGERQKAIEKEKEALIDTAKEKAQEKFYDEIYDELDDPIQYFVHDQGLYSMEDLMKQNFIGININEAAKSAISEDGWSHFLSLYDSNYTETQNGLVYFRE